MFSYFLIRMAKKKNFYLAVLIGIVFSILYIYADVYPYRDLKYGHSVYTIWIGTFTGSIYASLLYLLIPLLVAVPMADTYLLDRQSGYFQFVQVRNKKKQYFHGLFWCNFLAGVIVTAVPLLVNVYLCLMLLPYKKPDLIIGETHMISLYGGETLFPALYYDHPLLHLFMVILLAGIIGGVMASLALAVSCALKNVFMVWISVFVINYLYSLVTGIVSADGNATYQMLTYAHQVSPSGRMELPVILFMIVSILLFSFAAVYRGVMQYELE